MKEIIKNKEKRFVALILITYFLLFCMFIYSIWNENLLISILSIVLMFIGLIYVRKNTYKNSKIFIIPLFALLLLSGSNVHAQDIYDNLTDKILFEKRDNILVTNENSEVYRIQQKDVYSMTKSDFIKQIETLKKSFLYFGNNQYTWNFGSVMNYGGGTELSGYLFKNYNFLFKARLNGSGDWKLDESYYYSAPLLVDNFLYFYYLGPDLGVIDYNENFVESDINFSENGKTYQYFLTKESISSVSNVWHNIENFNSIYSYYDFYDLNGNLLKSSDLTIIDPESTYCNVTGYNYIDLDIEEQVVLYPKQRKVFSFTLYNRGYLGLDFIEPDSSSVSAENHHTLAMMGNECVENKNLVYSSEDARFKRAIYVSNIRYYGISTLGYDPNLFELLIFDENGIATASDGTTFNANFDILQETFPEPEPGTSDDLFGNSGATISTFLDEIMDFAGDFINIFVVIGELMTMFISSMPPFVQAGLRILFLFAVGYVILKIVRG